MIRDLLFQLEHKVERALDLIDLLKLQIEELEEENAALRTEHEQWRDDLVNLIKRFDLVEDAPDLGSNKDSANKPQKGLEFAVLED